MACPVPPDAWASKVGEAWRAQVLHCDHFGNVITNLAPKDLEQAAEWLGALVYDEPLREAVLAGQRRRAGAFGLDRVERELKTILESVA